MTDTPTLERMARAICQHGCTQEKYPNLKLACLSGDACEFWENDKELARAALQALRPPSAEVERAVALAQCSRVFCTQNKRCADWSPVGDPIKAGTFSPTCLTRARRTVEALATAALGSEIKTGRGK